MQSELLKWYDGARRDLPWRKTHDPYAIWVSEIMLQQTRAETVAGYWTRFLKKFPTVEALAGAPEEDVLKAWEGLGYYSRARNLRKCAQAVCGAYGGVFPSDAAALRALPGIGEYTAGAVASIAFGVRVPAVDGNVERVLSRLLGIREDVGIPSVRRRLREAAAALVPSGRPGDFNQAMMELGARVCQPACKCAECPIRAFCDACEAGDADELPVKQRKGPQKAVSLDVALVFYRDCVLLYRREDRLLNGLWCFPAVKSAQNARSVEDDLRNMGIDADFVENAGSARHVFTHLIWDMTLLRFAARGPACPDGWRWADAADVNALPLPTAMRAAKAYALGRLNG